MKRRSLLAGVLLAVLVLFTGCVPTRQPMQTEESLTADTRQEYRGMWFSYLEWSGLDVSSEQTFTQSVAAVMENCRALGLNTVIVQVRPFADAIYPNEYFPWSHLLTGVQGQDPGYDPLEIFVQQAHERGLRIEAWINPYRISLSAATPSELAEGHPARKWPEWVKSAEGGMYFEPSNIQVQQYICDAAEDLLRRYDVDGIQFDDYFYPTTSEEFDAQEYAVLGQGRPLADWRRDNVNSLVKKVYEMVRRVERELDRSLVFGISPQGNNDNNYHGQYSDVARWLSVPGYVDYVMPQVYWGYNFTLQNGSDRFAFENIIDEWVNMPRSEQVQLYFGLGAYRVGAGDGSSTVSDEWSSGKNLSEMVQSLRNQGAAGYALYRYDSLYRAGEYQALADAECMALQKCNT